MEDALKYENRKKLYQFLIDEYDFAVQEDQNFKAMGYSILLKGDFFLLRYYYDRLFIDIDIASDFEDPKNFYSLSFIRDLIYNPDAINAKDRTMGDNEVWIADLNSFLRRDFQKICELFNSKNYPDTKKRLLVGLEKQAYIRYPSTKPKN